MLPVSDQMEGAASVAQALRRDEPAFVSALDFGPFVRQGIGKGPSVLIGDQAGISLVDAGSAQLDYRMALLAHPGDVVLVRRRNWVFEAYLSDFLGMTPVTFLEAGGSPLAPVAANARKSQEMIGMLVTLARNSGGLTLKSYLTTGHVWRLAQTIGAASESCIHVCGPSPRVTRRANDKLWFSRMARQVIGTSATPPTRAAYGPAATAGLVQRISRLSPQVIVKIPDSAGSAGNVRLESETVAGMPLAALRGFILERLHRTGWQDTYPVLVGVWDQNVQSSPSAQLWIPHPETGPPRLDGLFEQRVTGEIGGFIGAKRAALHPKLQHQLTSEALLIALVLQELGYFGRCSLDAVVCQTEKSSELVHWIECNGRWGGVSIPLTAAEQLLEKPASSALVIVQEKIPDIRLRTHEMIGLLCDLLYHHGQRDPGLIIVAPFEREEGSLINLMAVSTKQRDANAIMERAMARIDAVAPRPR